MQNTPSLSSTGTIIIIILHPSHLPRSHPSPLPTFTSPFERQKSKMATNNWPSRKDESREPTRALRLIQVRQRAICGRLVDPKRHAVEDELADGRLGDGGRLEFPVGLGV